MTHRALDGIPSGIHGRVTHTDGRRPRSAAEFVGDTAFVIHLQDRNLHVEGVGQLDEVGTGVHFRQRDPVDLRRELHLWHLRSLPDQQLIAEPIASVR
jgi:hypothetical protein